MSKFGAYKLRNQRIIRLGYSGYSDYLNSEHWAELRAEAISKSGGICVFCQRRNATQVHHSGYSRAALLKGGASLYPICRPCHKFIEFNQDGTKATLGEMRRRQRLLLRLNRTTPPGMCSQCKVNQVGRKSTVCGRCARKNKP